MLSAAESAENLPSRALLVFLDETGDEHYQDPKHPVFGHAGCAILCRDYVRRIRGPWHVLKREHLGLQGKPFHAVDFERSRPSRAQIEAINAFLAARSFFRIAVTTDIHTKRPTGFDGHETVTNVAWNMIRRIAHLHSADAIVLIFENSERGTALLERDLPTNNLDAQEPFGRSIPVTGYTMPKIAMEAGLELADLIVHSSGKQQRLHGVGYANGTRRFTPDFEAFFHRTHPSNVFYQSVPAMELRGNEQLLGDYWPQS